MWSPPIDNRCDAPESELLGARLDLRDRLLDVERVARDVAGVGDLLRGERAHVEPRVVGAQQPRRVTNRVRPEACSRPVRDAAVEGHADDGDVAAVHLVPSRQPREGRRSGEPRDLQRVDRTDRHRLVGRRILGLAHDRQMLTRVGRRSWLTLVADRPARSWSR